MKRFLSVAATMGVLSVIGIFQDAQAATIISISEDVVTVPATALNPLADVQVGTIYYNITGSTAGVFRSPFETAAGTPIVPQFTTLGYTSIQGGGIGTWNFAASNTLSLFWGSPDSYNSIGFWSEADGGGSLLAGISGSDLTAVTPARGHVLVTLLLSEAFRSVVLSSTSNAFEFTNLSASLNEIPIPAALPLFATGLAVLGLIKWRKKRRVETAAA